MKTAAVSAGCLQYKHSQGSQREVGRLWERVGLRGQGTTARWQEKSIVGKMIVTDLRCALQLQILEVSKDT